MTFDYNKLLGLIKEREKTQADVAKHVGITENSLSNKIANKTSFKQREIISICDFLGIPADRLNEYFFAQRVEESSNSDSI